MREEINIRNEIDDNNNFVPLNEQEMITQSLEALDEFQQTGKSIAHNTMESWVENLGTDQHFSCSK